MQVCEYACMCAHICKHIHMGVCVCVRENVYVCVVVHAYVFRMRQNSISLPVFTRLNERAFQHPWWSRSHFPGELPARSVIHHSSQSQTSIF